MTAIEERQFKKLLKSTLIEVLEERQDLFREAVRESLEDLAMVRAIQSGLKTPRANRAKVMKILNSAD